MNRILTELPKSKFNRINWGQIKNTYIDILYNDKKYSIYVFDYKSPHLYLNSEVNSNFKMFTGHFMDCKFKELLGLIKHDYLYKINDIVEVNSGKIQIVKQISKIDGKFRYLCKCLNDGYEFESFEYNLVKGCGCAVCVGQKVMKGINDIATTDPWMIPLLTNKDNAYIYSHYSENEVDFICHNCGNMITKKIVNVFVKKGVSCPNCSDGISFPNKVMCNLLYQFKVNFTPEYSPEWVGRKSYDFYIPSMNIIIEMDGGLHNKDNKMNGQTAEESKAIDNYKDEQARLHDIEVIRIDCDYPNIEQRFEFIKNNILDNEKLNDLFNINKIDWNIIFNNSCKSIIKKTWELFNKGHDTIRISKELKISDSTVRVYLKKGNILNECNYDSKKSLIEGRKLGVEKMNKSTSKKVIDINTMETYSSINKISKLKNISEDVISNYCRGKNNTIIINHKKINIKVLFLEDYIYLIENKYNINDWNVVRKYLKDKYQILTKVY